eukprot:COSAG02_NODE_1297_length_13389_cov_6.460572_11_plen_196_part_00
MYPVICTRIPGSPRTFGSLWMTGGMSGLNLYIISCLNDCGKNFRHVNRRETGESGHLLVVNTPRPRGPTRSFRHHHVICNNISIIWWIMHRVFGGNGEYPDMDCVFHRAGHSGRRGVGWSAGGRAPGQSRYAAVTDALTASARAVEAAEAAAGASGGGGVGWVVCAGAWQLEVFLARSAGARRGCACGPRSLALC